MNKLQEDKILFEVGYKDRRDKALPHGDRAQLFDEVFSTRGMPNFDDLGGRQRKRANSIHVFEPPKIRRKKARGAQIKSELISQADEADKLKSNTIDSDAKKAEADDAAQEQDDFGKTSSKMLRSKTSMPSMKRKESFSSTETVPRDEVFDLDFAMENAWTRSFQRMKRAVAASEDNE